MCKVVGTLSSPQDERVLHAEFPGSLGTQTGSLRRH